MDSFRNCRHPHGRSDGKRILTIVYLHDDEIAFKEGESYYTYKRMKADGE